MNKKFTIITLALVLAFSLAFSFISSKSVYQPRTSTLNTIDGAFKYINMLRANQVTGKVTDEQVAEVMSEIKTQNQNKLKADWPLQWDFTGPDNRGGRTRCLVIDKDDPKILYTGGVSGAVFKSTNGGTTWSPLTSQDDNFGVVSMAQTSDGAVYYGTGEGSFVSTRGEEEGTPGFNGSGIYKSTDGETFSLVNGTQGLGYISRLTAHPTQNAIFAGTQAGLRYSDDGGSTWNILRSGSCTDIQFNKNGTAIAYIGSSFYRSTDPTNSSSWQLIQGIGSNRRGSVAWSESDPNYCYLLTVGTISSDLVPAGANSAGFNGLYRSTDEGVGFAEEVNEASRFFAPMSNLGTNTQGVYDQAIAVHPRDKDRVFIGGVGFAEWTDAEGPKMVGNNFDSPTNPFGIHADKHFITFDNTGDVPIMYICTDGGIAKTTNDELNRYFAINTGLASTQFYGIAASRNGRVIGGTQDNNTVLITRESFPRKTARDVIGGDGFRCEASEYDPLIMFGENQYGGLRRSTTGGAEMSTIWDNRIRGAFASTSQANTYFNTPLELWEDPAVIEAIKGATTELTSDDYLGFDTIMKSRLFMGMNDGIYMCNNVLRETFNPDKPSNDNIRWFKVGTIGGIHQLQSSYSGNSLFVGRTNGRVWRIDGFNSTDFDTTLLPNYNSIPSTLTATDITANLGVSGRTITSIAIDKADENRLVVTVGSYGNTNYVYETLNALDPVPTWRAIQSNLPRFPVYHAVISEDDPNTIILGTEFGIWASNNASPGGTPTWSEANGGEDATLPFPKAPVFELVQVSVNKWSGAKVYAGTHGMGIWETGSLLSSTPKTEAKKVSSVLAYPNPANNEVSLRTSIKGQYSLIVYNIQGSVVASFDGFSNNEIKLNTTEFVNGNYFVEIIGSNEKAVTKLIVQH